MKAIIALSILAVLNMFFGVRKMKKVLLPLIFTGLAITMILNIREWGTSVHYFNEMFIADNFSIAFSSVLILIGILIFMFCNTINFFQDRTYPGLVASRGTAGHGQLHNLFPCQSDAPQNC